MSEEVMYGRTPKLGDKIYVDLGDSIHSGGEITGILTKVKSPTEWEIDGKVYDLKYAVHIEVVR